MAITNRGTSWNSLVVQWLGLGAFIAGARVRSLVGELRYCKLRGVAKKKEEFLVNGKAQLWMPNMVFSVSPHSPLVEGCLQGT